ncbi:MAG TPA: DUF922 domain-containing protein, partial [Ferruginibacter sp.]|nr:DUF922 domain-containing protein [Ferruginibacter sp.]
MKKYSCLFVFLFSGNLLFCQEVVINGINKNRLLTWEDFTGKADKSSPYAANTFWNLNYSYQRVSFKGDSAKIEELAVKLELDKKRSWIKAGKETPELLKHEQGHFDIGLLCQKEFIFQLNNTRFSKTDYQSKVQSVFNTLSEKYRLMGLKYDEETNHSKNREAQQKWNDFFAKELVN